MRFSINVDHLPMPFVVKGAQVISEEEFREIQSANPRLEMERTSDGCLRVVSKKV